MKQFSTHVCGGGATTTHHTYAYTQYNPDGTAPPKPKQSKPSGTSQAGTQGTPMANIGTEAEEEPALVTEVIEVKTWVEEGDIETY
ncbi:hypothetical protein PQX77_015117 [Marasmius sp. AFHP31]|nr:hypothetical protein PQX77_015117 [Marasmius sp. AFHP31]